MTTPRLAQQINFLLELDKLKEIFRQSRIVPAQRRENSAEHSWHIAIMAMVFTKEYSEDLNLSRVLQMLLLHDIVEIDAGDTFAYDEQGYSDKDIREQQAAERIFGLLPEDQYLDFKKAWEEFEAGETKEARFANSMDRLMPLLHNYYSNGGTWKTHGTKKNQVQQRMAKIKEASPELWEYAESLINNAVRKGYLADG